MNAHRRGMTLLEVLLALGLFAMLSLFVFSIINSVLGLWQTSERRGSGDLAFAAAVERLRGDLGALHTGPRGWLVADDYEAIPAEGDQPPWRLPRLRFLANGGSLPADDPSGRKAVEVVWALVPTDPLSDQRVARLVRMTRIEDGNAQFDQDRVVTAALKAGGGVPMLDGVLYGEFQLNLQDGEVTQAYTVPAESPFDFPTQIDLTIERIDPDDQRRPMVLDDMLSVSGTRLVVRGRPPLGAPSQIVVGSEWLSVNGDFPRLNVVNRGLRNTLVADHPAGTVVFAPFRHQAALHCAADGRRVRP